MNHNTGTSFKYTYSAPEQEEIRKIRQKYQPQEEDKMTRLRKMDEKVTQKAMIIALVLGVLGALVMGIGMSMIMTEIGVAFGIPVLACMMIGGAIGVIGIVMMALAYPVYRKVLKTEREKIAPEILELTERQ